MNIKYVAALAAGCIFSVSSYTYLQEAYAETDNPSITCQTGYYPRDIRVPGQRLESHPKEGVGPVVIDNDDKDDIRYVVVAVCVRPLNSAEWGEYWDASVR